MAPGFAAANSASSPARSAAYTFSSFTDAGPRDAVRPMSELRLLEDDGLVRRTVDPTDRRATLVSLTPSGERAALSVYALGDRMISEVLEGWSAPDVRKYTALTRRFVADALTAADRMLERGLLPAHD